MKTIRIEIIKNNGNFYCNECNSKYNYQKFVKLNYFDTYENEVYEFFLLCINCYNKLLKEMVQIPNKFNIDNKSLLEFLK